MQKYNNNSKNDNNSCVNGYVLAKINLEALKAMSEVGLNVNDWQYVPLFEQYQHMLTLNVKHEAIYHTLAQQYAVSVSTVKRIIRRMLNQVKF